MKKCSKCKKYLSKEKFPIVNAKTGKISAKCLGCKRKYDVEYYHHNKNGIYKNKYQKQVERINSLRKKQYEYLLQNPCIDCGEKDPVVLEFDHKYNKKYNVGNMIRGGFSWKNILIEIKKCHVRCANCHRRKTAKDFNWFKGNN